MKYQYIEIYSRTGKFNFLNPTEESVSMGIRVKNEEGKIIKGCSISPEYEMQTSDFDPETIAEESAQMIEDYQKKLWMSSSREKDLEFVQWIRDNKKVLVEGQKKYEHDRLLKKKEKLEEELKVINEVLGVSEHI